MREIKFRMWDSKRKIIANYMNCCVDINTGEVQSFDDEGVVMGTESNKHLTLMQFTGLKDENGVEIYEGDIVENCGYQELCVVEYFEGQYIGRYAPKSYCGLGFYVCERDSIKVIGNIYENPEFLEVKS